MVGRPKFSSSFRFESRHLELIRRYSWPPERRRTLYGSIDLRPHHVVVDVGCGTGAFTRVVAQGLNPKKGGRIVGVDRGVHLLRTARRVASEEGFGPEFMSFEKADAKRLPFPDEFADRVVCQAVLWLLTEQEREQVLREMIRVCKKGGLVAAVEGAIDESVMYFPGNDRLTELVKKSSNAWLNGFAKVYGCDRSIGYKLPTMFRKLGLSRVRLDGVLDVMLESDDRVPVSGKMDGHRYFLKGDVKFLSKLDRIAGSRAKKKFVEKTQRVLIAGGMDWEEICELHRLRASYRAGVLRAPAKIGDNTAVAAGTAFITTGIRS